MQPATRSRASMFAVALAILMVIVGVWWIVAENRDDKPAPAPSVSPAAAISAVPEPSWTRSAPPLPDNVTASWAYLDSTDGTHVRTGDNELHPIDRLIIPGLAQLRANQALPDGPTDSPEWVAEMSVIAGALAQNTDVGDELITRAGGPTAFGKVLEACSLEDDTVTAEPARATILGVAQYAACLREGAVTDPGRAGMLLDYMRVTAGGIGDERGNDGGQRLAQFNSTVPAGEGRSRTWCMGIGAYWSAAVLVDWPTTNGELYGVAACAQVAKAEFPPDTQQAPESGSPTPAVPSADSTCPYGTCRGTD